MGLLFKDQSKVFFVFSFWLTAGPIAAGDWEITPGIASRIEYTDNARLASDGGQESATLLQVRPGISISGSSARAELDLRFNLDRQDTISGDGNNRLSHQLAADGNAELIPGWFYVDARANSSQVTIDNRQRVSFDNLTVGDRNQTDIANYSISPYISRPIGSYAIARISTSWSTTKTDTPGGFSSALSDSSSLSTSVALNSGSFFAKVPWTIGASTTTVENDSVADRTFDSIFARIGYQLYRQLQINVNLGYDDNDFSSTSETSGATWTVGAIWTPNQRTNLDISVGERFFGRTVRANGEYRRRFTTFRVRYSEQITTANQFFNQSNTNNIGAFTDLSSLSLQDFSRLGVRNDTPTLNDETFLQKRLDASIGWNRRRNSVTFRFFRNDRVDQGIAPLDELLTGFSMRASRDLSRDATISLNVNYQTNDFDNDNRSDDLFFITPEYRYNLGNNTNLFARYSYRERTSDQAGNDYQENIFVIGFSYRQ